MSSKFLRDKPDADVIELAYFLQELISRLNFDTLDLILQEASLALLESRGYTVADTCGDGLVIEKTDKVKEKQLWTPNRLQSY